MSIQEFQTWLTVVLSVAAVVIAAWQLWVALQQIGKRRRRAPRRRAR